MLATNLISGAPNLVASPAVSIQEKSKKQINWEKRRARRQEERQKRLAYRAQIRNKKEIAKAARLAKRAKRKENRG